jgi:MoaA/NifB/PqqE/SkfB family radical SAM enzyme
MGYTVKDRIIRTPDGISIYDSENGITLRLNHSEASSLLGISDIAEDYECPETVHLELTSRCNIDCPYCYVPRDSCELGTKKWEAIIDQLDDLGVFQLTFGGGEPFLRNDISHLARYARDRGVNVTVTTNGTLLDSVSIRDLQEFRQVNISYHEEASRNAFRIDETLRRLSGENVSTGISLIMSKQYLSQVGYIADLARETHSQLLLLTYKPVGNDSENCVEVKRIRSIAENLSKDGVSVGIDSLTNGKCLQKESFCVISSSGEVFPCSFIRQAMGNITCQSIREIWADRGKKIECPYSDMLKGNSP